MTNREMLDALNALRKLANMPMPLKSGLKIRSMIRSLNHLAEDVEAEKKKLIERLANRNENGDVVIVDLGNGLGEYQFGEKRAEFEQAHQELMLLECAGRPAPLKVDELGEIVIEPVLLLQLGELLED